MNEIEISLINHGTVNKNEVVIKKGEKEVSLYFSYKTIIAVDRVVSENDWSNTTGKFLNELEPNKHARVKHSKVLEEAQKRLKEVLV